MGMSRGSKWKRIAIIPHGTRSGDEFSERLCSHLRAHGVNHFEWWRRNIRTQGRTMAWDDWMMVPRGDWPLAYVLASSIKQDG